MSTLVTGFIILIVAATAWDMGMRAMPLVAASIGLLFVWASVH